jgi:adenosylhomocysteine nucleosidase
LREHLPRAEGLMLLFVAADPREFSGWVPRWQGVQAVSLPVNWARAGKWKGREVMAVANGAGSERAFAAVLLSPKPTAVCNIGFCGAADPELRIGDVFTAVEVLDASGRGLRKYETLVPEVGEHGIASLARMATGVAVSIDHVAETAVEKCNLREMGASIMEMEAAGVARAAEDLGLPFYCIRAVSDLANEDFENDFNAALGPDGRFSTFRLVMGAMASPRKRFGELLRLQRRTALAAKQLGDFLADCKFK